MKAYVCSTGIQVKDNNATATNVCMKKLSSVGKGSRQIYDGLIHNNEQPNCCPKWEHKLNKVINWGGCFHSVHKIQDVNLKWFQMRIMHRLIGTNVILKQMGVRTDENCSFCNDVKYSIEHNIIGNVQLVRRFGLASLIW